MNDYNHFKCTKIYFLIMLLLIYQWYSKYVCCQQAKLLTERSEICRILIRMVQRKRKREMRKRTKVMFSHILYGMFILFILFNNNNNNNILFKKAKDSLQCIYGRATPQIAKLIEAGSFIICYNMLTKESFMAVRYYYYIIFLILFLWKF